MALTDYSGEKLSTSHPLVRRVIAATFPTYRGRKVKARLWTRPRVLDNYWSGGSRSYYVAIRVLDGAVASFGTDNPFLRETHEAVDLPAGVILVEHSIFMGKDSGLTIWMRADDPAMLNSGLLSSGV